MSETIWSGSHQRLFAIAVLFRVRTPLEPTVCVLLAATIALRRTNPKATEP